MGSFGLAGLDRLLCFMMVKELQAFMVLGSRVLMNPKDKTWNDMMYAFSQSLSPVKGVVGKKIKTFKIFILSDAFMFTMLGVKFIDEIHCHENSVCITLPV